MNRDRFIRYPGGKQRLINHILPYLPKPLNGTYIEPFCGAAAVFFSLKIKKAILADINNELIELYKGIQHHPKEVWDIFMAFPSTKEGYYQIRDLENRSDELAYRAARTLFLNRTCFKGMWRHNSKGKFNVGYGGQDRRWVITEENLLSVSKKLQKIELICSDFEQVINKCTEKDFLFVDPPYQPHKRELKNNHYLYNSFKYADHQRLAKILKDATRKGILWAITVSSHPDIVQLYKKYRVITFPQGTGKMPGLLSKDAGEILILNY